MKKINLSSDSNFGINDKDGIGNKKECVNEIKEEDGCGCCSGPDLSFLKIPSSQSTNPKTVQLFLEEQEKDRERKEKKKDKNDKILILIGLALTFPLVTIEILEFYNVAGIDVVSTDYILLALATPIQVLLGGPFYRRFFGSLKKRMGFTVDTLVVLSTTVAYVYSIVVMLTNQDIRFFEASASVLTIFTIESILRARFWEQPQNP